MPAPLRAQFTRAEVRIREDLIIKYVVSLVKDIQGQPGLEPIVPYFLEYGILDWAWPLRFVKNNEPCRGYKYYSKNAYNAVLAGQTKFTRDHFFPKREFKRILLAADDPKPDQTRKLMETYGEVCVITREEHALLKDAGLDRGMPHGWKIGDDIFERYKATGIKWRINDQQWPG
jgi:hypothetical protein